MYPCYSVSDSPAETIVDIGGDALGAPELSSWAHSTRSGHGGVAQRQHCSARSPACCRKTFTFVDLRVTFKTTVCG